MKLDSIHWLWTFLIIGNMIVFYTFLSLAATLGTVWPTIWAFIGWGVFLWSNLGTFAEKLAPQMFISDSGAIGRFISVKKLSGNRLSMDIEIPNTFLQHHKINKSPAVNIIDSFPMAGTSRIRIIDLASYFFQVPAEATDAMKPFVRYVKSLSGAPITGIKNSDGKPLFEQELLLKNKQLNDTVMMLHGLGQTQQRQLDSLAQMKTHDLKEAAKFNSVISDLTKRIIFISGKAQAEGGVQSALQSYEEKPQL